MGIGRIRNVFKLYKGNLVAQILNLFVFFGAAHILPVESIGTYFIFIAIVTIIGSSLSFQMHLTLALPRSLKAKIENLYCGILILLMSNALFLLGVIISYFGIDFFINVDIDFKVWYFILPLSSLLFGLNLIGEHFYVANKKYSLITNVKVIRVIIFFSTALFFQYVLSSNYSLVLGYIGGQIAMVIIFYSRMFQIQIRKHFLKRVDLLLYTYYKSYIRILVYNSIVSPINIVSNQLPYIFLPILFDKGVTANYGMAFKTLLFPLMLFSQVYGQDFYVNASDVYKKSGSLLKLFYSEMNKLFRLAIIPFIVVFIVSPWFFKTVMGADWIMAGIFTRLILLWMFVNFIKTPLSSLISILHIQKKWLIFELIQLMVRLGVLGYSYVLVLNVNETLLFYASVSAIAGLVLMIIIYHSIKQYENKSI